MARETLSWRKHFKFTGGIALQRFATTFLLFAASGPLLFAAERPLIDHLQELANSKSASDEFRQALVTAMGADRIEQGTAVVSNGPDFIWAVESAQAPVLFVNDGRFADMQKASGRLWFHVGKLATGNAYTFHYRVGDTVLGGSLRLPAYTPDSYAQPGVPRGTLSERMVHVSETIYAGMETNYWVYLPAQYNAAKPAALMIWQDGNRLIGRNNEELDAELADRDNEPTCILCPSLVRVLEVTDNLLHREAIPVMVHLFVQAGTLNGESMRSVQYDSVTDRYPRFLIEELLPQVYSRYNIRRDGYGHAIQGQSSGGIAAFNAGWHFPEQFSRIASQHGTFTAVAFRNQEPEAGHVYPTWVRRADRKNLRVWISHGSEDYENEWGSWPTQNLQLANSLKFRGYDFRYYLGNGDHHAAIWAAKLPEAMMWLWRDYDPAKTGQVYEQDPDEKDKPFFRIKSLNR
jgi:enterochelin esterase family protein